jgi:hypothetical protein
MQAISRKGISFWRHPFKGIIFEENKHTGSTPAMSGLLTCLTDFRSLVFLICYLPMVDPSRAHKIEFFVQMLISSVKPNCIFETIFYFIDPPNCYRQIIENLDKFYRSIVLF